MSQITEKKIGLELTPAEALVLFEWLARSDSENTLPVAHAAEQQVLWSLEGQLERVLQEVLSADYQTLLEEARRKVVGNQ
jgi:hypothetical protein